MQTSSFVLLLSLYFMQQETGTSVTVQNLPPIVEITSKQIYDAGARAWLEKHDRVAVEPTSDCESPDDDKGAKQPVKDRFELLVPVAVCVRSAEVGWKSRRYERVRAECSRLAVDAAGPGASTADIMARSIYFESFILRGGDETQKRMRILPDEPVLVLVGPGEHGDRK